MDTVNNDQRVTALGATSESCLRFFRQLENYLRARSRFARAYPAGAKGNPSRPPFTPRLKQAGVRAEERPGQKPNLLKVEDLLGLDGHCSFLSGMLERRYLDSETRSEFAMRLDELKARREDQRLHLGVIGEFSSGKSTLINALLREEFLESDILQATTCSLTVLSHGPRLDVEILLDDGRRLDLYRNGLGIRGTLQRHIIERWPICTSMEVKAFADTYVAREEQAAEVTQVNVYGPNRIFENGLVVIDTPGINSGNPRHSAMTKAAIEHLCDAVIVAIPAAMAGSQALFGFLREQCSAYLHRCIFVLTKIDHVPKRELDRLCSHVQRVVRRELGIVGAPKVLPMAARVLLDSPACGVDVPADQPHLCENSSLVEMFYDSERELYGFLEKNREIVLVEVASDYTRFLFRHLKGNLENLARRYEERHAALEAARIPDLEGFVEGYRSMNRITLETLAASKACELSEFARELRDEFMDAVIEAIDTATSTWDLQLKLKQLSGGLGLEHGHRIDAMYGDGCAAIRSEAENCRERFSQDFTIAYRNLAALAGTFNQPNAATLPVGWTSEHSAMERNGIGTKGIADANQKESKIQLGGAGIGTVVGAFVGGPLGAIIGGFLGSFASKVFGPKMEEVKAKAHADMPREIKSNYEDLEMKGLEQIHGFTEGLLEKLNSLVDEHYAQYRFKVGEMIELDMREKQELSEFSALITGDLEALGARSAELDRMLDKVRGLERGH